MNGETPARRIVLDPGAGRTLPLGGDRITFKAVGEDTAGMLAFIEYWASPGSRGTSLHSHDGHEEGFYIVEGALDMQLGDDRFRARPGAFVFVPRGVPHAFWNAGAEPCRFVATFSPPGFERFFEEQVTLLAGHPTPDPAAIDDLARRHGLRALGPSPAP